MDVGLPLPLITTIKYSFPMGDIQICCMDYGLKNRLGNLEKLSRWEDIFSTNEYKRIAELSNKAEYTNDLDL